MIKFNTKHSGLFAAGVVFGTAGIKVLSSKDDTKLNDASAHIYTEFLYDKNNLPGFFLTSKQAYLYGDR